ncbi:hypothetical protein D477_018389 [Arthrobacter crystallopoietes BAB-32]|uniref:Uncharacterized protein n=1 Tax=Arthrobacter crystallopoietes BAB-32 TaxID=1246476 RepID=N1UYE0_9MICC|nr:hypothetical protein [Arthrobacter crystallopoietes]EMY32779.1 hypothetical protein D477_018389 [Arthrobacter crystallopoietes BAB-32]
MSERTHLSPKDPFPEDLGALSQVELERLAAQLQEEVFRECNSRSGRASALTLHRQSLVEFELSLRQPESPESVSPGPA